MDVHILEEIGLTNAEVKVYIALLRLGASSTTAIIREAKIHPSKVYDNLDKLIAKGIVAYAVQNGKKVFKACDLASLAGYLQEKKRILTQQEEAVRNLLPELELLKKEENESIASEVYEGFRGFQFVQEKALALQNAGDIHYIIGAPKIGNELWEGYLLEWHERRIKKKVRWHCIYDSNVRKYGRIREAMPYTKVRYLPKGIVNPMWIEIFKDYVSIGHIRGRGCTLFLVHDAVIAKGYRDYFKLLWKSSEH